MGFDPRYNAYGTDKKKTSFNVIHGGGSGDDNTSIWLVVWGYSTVHGIYPKGSKAGLSQKDLGEATKTLPPTDPCCRFTAATTSGTWVSRSATGAMWSGWPTLT